MAEDRKTVVVQRKDGTQVAVSFPSNFPDEQVPITLYKNRKHLGVSDMPPPKGAVVAPNPLQRFVGGWAEIVNDDAVLEPKPDAKGVLRYPSSGELASRFLQGITPAHEEPKPGIKLFTDETLPPAPAPVPSPAEPSPHQPAGPAAAGPVMKQAGPPKASAWEFLDQWRQVEDRFSGKQAAEKRQAALDQPVTGLRSAQDKIMAKAAEFLDNRRSAPNEPTNLWDVVGDTIADPTRMVPFVGTATQFGEETLPVYQAAKRIEAGQATPQDVMLIQGHREKLQKQAQGHREKLQKQAQGQTTPAMVADILTQLPAFAGEFALTGGIHNIVKEGLEWALKNVAQKGAANLAKRAATSTAGAVAQSAAMVPRLVEGTADRMTPELRLDAEQVQKMDDLIAREGDGFAEAAVKAFGENAIEVWSERTGSALKHVPGFSKAKDAVQDMKRAVMRRWIATHPNASMDDLFKRVAKKTAWDGVFEEMFEERVGEAARAAVGLEQYQPPTRQQLFAELAAFSVPGASRSAISNTVGRAAESRDQKRREEALKTLTTAIASDTANQAFTPRTTNQPAEPSDAAPIMFRSQTDDDLMNEIGGWAPETAAVMGRDAVELVKHARERKAALGQAMESDDGVFGDAENAEWERLMAAGEDPAKLAKIYDVDAVRKAPPVRPQEPAPQPLPKADSKTEGDTPLAPTDVQPVDAVSVAPDNEAATPAPVSQEFAPDAARPPVKRASGSRTQVLTGKTPVDAEYAVVDLDSLNPSHDFRTGVPVSNVDRGQYPQGLQPRDYRPDSDEAAKVVRFAGEKKAPYYISTHPGADSGPPTISPDGTVINGNGRVSSLQYAAHHARDYGWYRDALREQAAQFGVSPEDVDRMKHPVLVRVVDMAPDSEDAVRFARAGNVSTTQSQSAERTAASLKDIIDANLLENLGLDDDTTFSDAVSGSSGAQFRRTLRDALPPSEVSRYMTESGDLTDAGKEFARSLLLTTVVPVETVEALGANRAALKRSIEGVIPQLLRFRRDMPDLDISPQLNEALAFVAKNPEVRTSSEADVVLGQSDMFGAERKMSPGGRMLLDFVLNAGGRPRTFRQSMVKLLSDVSMGQGLFAADFQDTPTLVAEALGVEKRDGAEFGPAAAGQEAVASTAPQHYSPYASYGMAIEGLFNMGEMGEAFSGADGRESAVVMGLPDIVELLKRILDGKAPRVLEKLRQKRGLIKYGQFSPKRGNTDLRADMMIGPVLDVVPWGQSSVAAAQQKLVEKGAPLDRQVVMRRWDKKAKAAFAYIYLRDENFAARSLGHEIGHAADWLSDKDMKKGNILGRIASIHGYMMRDLPRRPGQGSGPLTREEREVIFKRAQERERGRHKGDPTGRQRAIRETYKKMLAEEYRWRNLISLPEVREELKALTMWWNPFDPARDKGYTAYRHSAPELYAEALSVLINNPQALQKKAPVFFDAFFAYLKNKPEVQEAYEAITQQVRSGNSPKHWLDRYRQMLANSEERWKATVREDKKKRREAWNIRRLLKFFAAEAIDNRAHIPDTGDNDPSNPRYWTSEVVYLDSRITQMMRDIYERVEGKLRDAGVSRVDFDVFLGTRRAAHERKYYFNPLGVSGKKAEEMLEALRAELSPRQWEAIEAAAQEFWKIRQEYVISMLEESNLLTPRLLDLIKNNEEYVTFAVQEYMEDQYGKSGATAAIYKQIGTLKDISSPLTATIMKDMALMRAAVMNQAKQVLIAHMDNVAVAKRGADGKFLEPNDKDMALFITTEEGEAQGWYIPKDMADWYNADPTYAGLAAKVLRVISAPSKALFTEYMPGFGLWNLQRDARTAIKHMPDGLLKSSAGMTWHFGRTFRDAFVDAFMDRSTPLAREMYMMNMLIPDMGYRAKEHENYDTRLEGMWQERAILQPHRALWQRILLSPFTFIRRSNKMMERWTKMAGYRYLKAHKNIDETSLFAREFIRTEIGSPDFRAGGRERQILNNMFIFSNPQTQGMRASYKNFKRQPGNYLIKMVAMDIIPKLIMYSMEIALFGKVWHFLFGGDDDEPLPIETAMQKMSEYLKGQYLVAPVGETSDGKGVAIPLPQDHIGQFFGALTWAALRQQEGLSGAEIYDALRSQNPFAFSNLTPAAKVLADVSQVAAGRNPYDAYYGTHILKDDVLKAGGLRPFVEVLKYEYNANLGQLYTFRSARQKAVETEAASVIERATNIPALGTVVKRFVRVSDQGLDDSLQRRMRIEGKEHYRRQLALGDIIDEHASKEKSLAGRDHIGAAWERALADGVVPDGYAYSTFRRRYENVVTFKHGSAEEKARVWATGTDRRALNAVTEE